MKSMFKTFALIAQQPSNKMLLFFCQGGLHGKSDGRSQELFCLARSLAEIIYIYTDDVLLVTISP